MGETCRVYYKVLPKNEATGKRLLESQRETALELLKQGFWEFFHVEWKEELIKREPEGKPYYTGGEGFYFNISHCNDAVAVAVAVCPVGVDVEGLRDVKYRTVEKCCNIEEMAYVFGGVTEERNRGESLREEEMLRFLNLWTLKESYVKMTGRGLRIPPKEVNFRIEEFYPIDSNTFQGKGTDQTECFFRRASDVVIALTLQKKIPETDAQVRWISCTSALEED